MVLRLHSQVFFAKQVTTSECVVQQGDPLKPLRLFALQPSLRAAATDAELCVGYPDDLVLAGSDVQVSRALRWCWSSRSVNSCFAVWRVPYSLPVSSSMPRAI